MSEVAQGTLVQFVADVTPYCKGDVVRLSDDEKERVDLMAEKRELDKAYKPYKEAKADAK